MTEFCLQNQHGRRRDLTCTAVLWFSHACNSPCMPTHIINQGFKRKKADCIQQLLKLFRVPQNTKHRLLLYSKLTHNVWHWLARDGVNIIPAKIPRKWQMKMGKKFTGLAHQERLNDSISNSCQPENVYQHATGFWIKKQSIFTVADLKLFINCFLQPLGMHCSKLNYIISSILQMSELGLEKGK